MLPRRPVECVVGVRNSDELDVDSGRPGPFGEAVGAVDRHQMISLADDDQSGRRRGGDMGVGGDAGVSVRKLLRRPAGVSAGHIA
jgi:hypothetical protein